MNSINKMLSEITITNEDLRNASWNNLCALSHAPLAGLAAFAINKFAHKIIGIQEKSTASYVVKAVAFGTGIAVSAYLYPKIPLVSFSADKVREFFVVGIISSIVSALLFPKFISGAISGYAGTCTSGSLVGYAPRFHVIPMAVIGALIGAAL